MLDTGFAKRDGPLELAYPRNAYASWTVSGGAAWAWPANYTQIVAATLESFVPHEVNLCISFSALVTGLLQVWLEYELAIGAAGSEVVIARYTETLMDYMILPGASTQNLAAFGRTFPIGPKEIPLGTRIAHRVRCSLADTSVLINLTAYVTGYAGGDVPLTYTPYTLRPWLAGVNRASSDISRIGDTYTTITPAAFPNYGAWVEDTTAAPNDLIIWGVAFWKVSADISTSSLYVQIGTGAAPNEVPRRVVHCPGMGSFRQMGLQTMRYPVLVKKGERIAIRAMGPADPYQVKLLWEAA